MRTSEGGLLHVVFVGESKYTAIRKRSLHDRDLADTTIDQIGSTPDSLRPGSVCFVALANDEATEQSKRLLESGCHVFLDTPLLPLRDLQHLAAIAEEAGVEVGLSRPLRYSEPIAGWTDRATIAGISAEFGDAPESWQTCLLDTLDLSVYLCGSGNARRVEASVERADRLWPVFAAISLRFDNGSLALATLRKTPSSPGPTRCTITAGPAVQELEIVVGAESYAAETTDFLRRVARGTPAPVSVSDGLAGVRLLDQVQALLR
ncbi:MAG: hypothetical protein HKN13_01905 [Rhodothermales bacterium]|nr:hypothetical protein [Rhodothermales bacterium]